MPGPEPRRDAVPDTAFARSLQTSRERRHAAQRRRRALRGRRSALAVTVALAAFSGGAVAATGGASPSPSPSSSDGSASSSSSGHLTRGTIKAVQRRLHVRADGVIGAQTRRAIRRFQRREGLRVDGRLGPATLRALGVRARRTSRSDGRGISGSVAARLERIAQCESGGDPTAVSPGGTYRGKYQFSRETWRSLGGTGDPAEAPEGVQDEMAAKLLQRQGPSAWPNCA